MTEQRTEFPAQTSSRWVPGSLGPECSEHRKTKDRLPGFSESFRPEAEGTVLFRQGDSFEGAVTCEFAPSGLRIKGNKGGGGRLVEVW